MTCNPDWNNSPSWAEWFGIDEDGYSWWFETKPEANIRFGYWLQESEKSYDKLAGRCPEKAIDWKNSLRKRP